MNRFCEYVGLDAKTMRFYAECRICYRKQYGGKPPLICRHSERDLPDTKGKANKLVRGAFDHAKAAAAKRLVLRFNLCRRCNRWVCDDCYDITDDIGTCLDCSHKE